VKFSLKNLILAALFAALVYVATAWLPRLPIPGGGYVHVGDVFVFLAAALLPKRYALPAAGIGAALADLLTGFALWAPASLVIKMLCALCLTCRHKVLCKANWLGLLAALPITVGGYYLAEVLMVGNFTSPLAGMPFNAAQWLVSAVLFVLAGAAADRGGLKRFLR